MSSDDLALMLFDESAGHGVRQLLSEIGECEELIGQERGLCEKRIRELPTDLLRTVARPHA